MKGPISSQRDRCFGARSRYVQKATVTANVRQRGSYLSDQGAVWDEVSASLGELGVHSETSDFREARERVAHWLEEFVKAIRPVENQTGSIFINAQGILGLEMLGTPSLFSQVCDKVTRSFAFEVLGAPDFNGASAGPAKHWWDKILKSPFTRHASPAAGEDIRVSTGDLIGSGLIWNEVLVHFPCFPDMRTENNRPSQTRVPIGRSATAQFVVIVERLGDIVDSLSSLSGACRGGKPEIFYGAAGQQVTVTRTRPNSRFLQQVQLDQLYPEH